MGKIKAENVSAAVLTGGQYAKKCGQNEAFIDVNGMTVIQKTVDLLKNIFSEIIIVSDSSGYLPFFNEDILRRNAIFTDAGSLGGIHSALTHATKEAVFVVADDMPFLCAHLIKTQLACIDMLHCDCLVPRIGSYIEPLHSIYRTGLKHKINEYLLEGNDCSVNTFISSVNTYYLNIADNDGNRKIFNHHINSARDLFDVV